MTACTFCLIRICDNDPLLMRRVGVEEEHPACEDLKAKYFSRHSIQLHFIPNNCMKYIRLDILTDVAILQS